MVQKRFDVDVLSLRAYLNYDPGSGVFTWFRDPPAGPRMAGKTAGYRNASGYWVISFDGRPRKAHRLAWLYMTGEWPKHLIDHRDGNRSNNRWANLRGADDMQNALNRKRRSDNKSGLKGVYWNKEGSRWATSITAQKRRIFLGYFDCKAAAYFTYLVAAETQHGEFARAA